MIKSVLCGLVCGIAAVFAICTLLGIIMLILNIPDEILSIISVAILALSAYAAGYFSTQLFRSKGMIQGAMCGAGLFFTAFVLSAAFKSFTFSDMAAIKAAACLTAGVVGGVKGVNTKKTKERH